MLKIDLKPGESVSIGGTAVVTLEAKSGQLARLVFKADPSVRIVRTQQRTVAQIAAKGGLAGNG
jgi:hypothetical protein